MTTVTLQNLLDFAKSKNPNDKVIMEQASSDNECGCLMVQYGREKFPEFKHFGCGAVSWFNDKNNNRFASLNFHITDLRDFGIHFNRNPYTYEQIVRALEEYQKQKG
jgi:hypothetical protein